MSKTLLGLALVAGVICAVEVWAWTSAPTLDDWEAEAAAHEAARTADWQAHPRDVWKLHDVDGIACKPAWCEYAGKQTVPWGDDPEFTHIPGNDDELGYIHSLACQTQAQEENAEPELFTSLSTGCGPTLPTPRLGEAPDVQS